MKWSNKQVAEQAGVSDMLVRDVRNQLQESCGSPAAKAKDAPRKGKDGKIRKQRLESASEIPKVTERGQLEST